MPHHEGGAAGLFGANHGADFQCRETSQPGRFSNEKTDRIIDRGIRIIPTKCLSTAYRMISKKHPADRADPAGVVSFLCHAAFLKSSTVIPGSHAMHSLRNWHHEQCMPGCGWWRLLAINAHRHGIMTLSDS